MIAKKCLANICKIALRYKGIAAAVGLTYASTSYAVYNNNFATRITEILTYDSGIFLIGTRTMPTGSCSAYWIVTTEVPADARQMMLSRAMIAREKGEEVTIGYDSETCVNGWYRVHRIG